MNSQSKSYFFSLITPGLIAQMPGMMGPGMGFQVLPGGHPMFPMGLPRFRWFPAAITSLATAPTAAAAAAPQPAAFAITTTTQPSVGPLLHLTIPIIYE